MGLMIKFPDFYRVLVNFRKFLRSLKNRFYEKGIFVRIGCSDGNKGNFILNEGRDFRNTQKFPMHFPTVDVVKNFIFFPAMTHGLIINIPFTGSGQQPDLVIKMVSGIFFHPYFENCPNYKVFHGFRV